MVCAVLLDIGGVLEITPSTGWPQRWAAELVVVEGARAVGMAGVLHRDNARTIAEVDLLLAG